MTKSKTGFQMPHNYVVIFSIIILAAILTWVIPAGSYDRVQDEDEDPEHNAIGVLHPGDAADVLHDVLDGVHLVCLRL